MPSFPESYKSQKQEEQVWRNGAKYTIKFLGQWSDQLGVWVMPDFVGLLTLTIALCLPYAVFFEAAASLVLPCCAMRLLS
ncbi:hypothetical protein Pint_05558 [Pistacia integerrima]|uniref:Uncharacterized protein n=1 Tax=Pistacia integerrima TaxID=434235 RepID=A0ACC0Z3Q7_9ROSI|nr:hypothetical protein Pint_05558 [Pistacia integerrima]